MDVDTTTTTTKFTKLTPEERTQLAKEGRCFRCRLLGHLARNCPKNATPPVKAREASSPEEATPPGTTSTPTTPAPPTAQKLTRAQQIRALEVEMEEEERAQYMDDRDMGEDFWSAGA